MRNSLYLSVYVSIIIGLSTLASQSNNMQPGKKRGPREGTYKRVKVELDNLAQLRTPTKPNAQSIIISAIEQLPESPSPDVVNATNPVIYILQVMHNIADLRPNIALENVHKFINSIWPIIISILKIIEQQRSWIYTIPYSMQHSTAVLRNRVLSADFLKVATQFLKNQPETYTSKLIAETWDIIAKNTRYQLWHTPNYANVSPPGKPKKFAWQPPLFVTMLKQFNRPNTSRYMEYPLDAIITHTPTDMFSQQYRYAYQLLDLDDYSNKQPEEIYEHAQRVYAFLERILNKQPKLAHPPLEAYPSPAMNLALRLSEFPQSALQNPDIQSIAYAICELLYQYGGMTPFISQQPTDFYATEYDTPVEASTFVQQFIIKKALEETYHSLALLNAHLPR